MDVLSSRVLLRPVDLARSTAFYRDTLGLAIYREFGEDPWKGTVFFLGGGFLEVSGRSPDPAGPNVQLWLQVRDVDERYKELQDAFMAGRVKVAGNLATLVAHQGTLAAVDVDLPRADG